MLKIEKDRHKITVKFFGIKISFNNPNKLKNNKIYLINKKNQKRLVSKIRGLKVRFEGENSNIYIHTPIKFLNCQIICKNNEIITIDEAKNGIRNLDIRACGNNSEIKIGKNFSCSGYIVIFTSPEENTKVIIGEDCLFADNICIMTSDSHKIYLKDDKTKKPINKGGNIEIGNHVWCGKDVTFLKNSKVSDNSIIAGKSLINKKFEDTNLLLAEYLQNS